MKKLVSAVIALAMTAAPLTAFAEEPTPEFKTITESSDPKSGDALVTTEIAPSYIVTIPADTNVPFNSLSTDFGSLTLTEARLEAGRYVRVHLSSDFKLKNKADAEKVIPYDVISTTPDNTGSLKTFDVQLEFKGDTCPLAITITQDDWDKAYAGEYSDTITFDIQYTDPPEQQGGGT